MDSSPNNARVQYENFIMGWVDGARCTAMWPASVNSEDQLIRDAYNAGYMAGRGDRNKASEVAAASYGYTPSVLHLQTRGDDGT